jgi:hypothetical protein
MMEKHFELSDELCEQQFKDCTLSPSVFSHEAHLRLAYIHIKKYGVEAAINNICMQIKVFSKSAGAENKYNKTLTIAAIRAVNHFMNHSDTDNFTDFIKQFPRLKYNFKELISFHYSLDIFNSPLAKTEYVEPDLMAFS